MTNTESNCLQKHVFEDKQTQVLVSLTSSFLSVYLVKVPIGNKLIKHYVYGKKYGDAKLLLGNILRRQQT